MWAEQRLKELSYLPGVVNGAFDTKTRGAVIAFQKWEGLTRDGVIGTTVWTRLHTATRPKPTRIGTTDPWIEVEQDQAGAALLQERSRPLHHPGFDGERERRHRSRPRAPSP